MSDPMEDDARRDAEEDYRAIIMELQRDLSIMVDVYMEMAENSESIGKEGPILVRFGRAMKQDDGSFSWVRK